MSAPVYARLRRIEADAKAGILPSVTEPDKDEGLLYEPPPIDDLQPWSTPTRVIEELLEGQDLSKPKTTMKVYIEGTKTQMDDRRRSMKVILRAKAGPDWQLSVKRVDPRAPGGIKRIGYWEIAITHITRRKTHGTPTFKKK